MAPTAQPSGPMILDAARGIARRDARAGAVATGVATGTTSAHADALLRHAVDVLLAGWRTTSRPGGHGG